jgi:hypothetical protein
MAGHDTEMPTDGARTIAPMASLPSPLPAVRDPAREEASRQVSPERLAECVRRLDPGTRALLDLSVRRRFRDDTMAPLLKTDAFHLAWRRARALERVATAVGGDEPMPLGQVRAALEALPAEAWDPLSAAPGLPRVAGQEAESGKQKAELVPASSQELDAPRAGVFDRLDAFATEAPTLRRAFRDVGRAFGRKAVRMVVWRRRTRD